MVTDGVYREASPRPRPIVRFEASARAFARDGYGAWLVMAVTLLMPLGLFASSVDVSCATQPKICEVSVHRLLLGTKTEVIDMRGATAADYEGRGKTTSDTEMRWCCERSRRFFPSRRAI